MVDGFEDGLKELGFEEGRPWRWSARRQAFPSC